MGEKVLVLSADKWAMNDDNGKPMSGLTVNYINEYRDNDANNEGYKPTKISVPADLADEFLKRFKSVGLPALCELEFGTRPGKDNKPAIVVNGVKVISHVQVFPKAA